MSTDGTLPMPGTTQSVTAFALTVTGAVAVVLSWSVLWLPVPFDGGPRLALWPVAMLVTALAEMTFVVALVLAIVAADRKRSGARVVLAAVSAVLLVAAPVVTWFGGPLS